MQHTSDSIRIVGYGAVTAFGHGVDAVWSALLEGRSGVAVLAVDGPEWASVPVRVGAAARLDVGSTISAVRAKRMDRTSQLALVAAGEAWNDAGRPAVDPDRLAVVVGTGIGGIETLLREDDVLERSGARRVSPRTVPMLMANAPAAEISIEYGARGGAYTAVAACASGAEAIAAGARLIRSGEADVVIAGGTEAAVTPITLAAFAQSQALAKPSRDGGDPAALSRPFDRDRHGFVLGEGAGFVILERASHASARGVAGRATLAGWGITSDASHLTAPREDGSGQVLAMRHAVRMAGIDGRDIGYVNAHATSTPVGDSSEARAILAAVGAHAAVTAPKSNLGHSFGAAGALEAILTVRSIETGLIPPTLNLDNLDAGIDLDVVSGGVRRTRVSAGLSNSFGFGGHNAALVVTE